MMLFVNELNYLYMHDVMNLLDLGPSSRPFREA